MPRHLAVPSRMYTFGRETSKLLLSASRKDFWLSLLLSMLEIKRESVARKGRQLQGPISYIPLSPGIFPTPSPYLFPHSHWVTPTFPCWSVSPHLSHAPHCCRTRHVGNDAPSLTKVTDAQSWATTTAHLWSALFVMPPKCKQSRGCPAWLLHYGAAVLWWSRVTVMTTLLKFCFQHANSMLGAKCFSLSP